MARNITTVQKSAGGGGGSYMDPYDQPCFSIWSNDNGGSNGFFAYNHRLDRHSFVFGAGDGYGMYRTYSSYAPEFMNDNSGSNYYQTNGHMQSNNDYPSGTNMVGYLGHQYFLSTSKNSSSAYGMGNTRGANYRAQAMKQVGTLPNETRQDYAMFTNHAGNGYFRLQCHARSTTWHRNHDMHFGYSKGDYTDIPCQWSQSTYGGTSFNRKTKKLLTMETNGSRQWKPHIWHNCPDFRAISNNLDIWYDKEEQYNGYGHSSSSLREWFNDNAGSVTVYDQEGGIPHTHTDEDQYHGMPVMCDNGKVFWFQQIPHYGAWACRWDENGNNSGNLRTWSQTTSYGREQGERFGMRWQQTSDGRYIVGYCPYYYYGSGWLGAFVRVSDGKWLWDQTTDTSYGYQICPIGKSSFFMNHSYNTDSGHGLYHTIVDMERQFATRSDGDRISPHQFTGETHSCLDTPYWSTAYPAIIPAMYDTHLFTSMNNGVVDADEFETIQDYDSSRSKQG